MRAVCTTHSESETIELASRLGRALVGGDVVLLHGELGAGKTRFVMGLARGLGHTGVRVSSPTYVLVHHYETKGSTSLVHVDAYRMGEDDASTLGLDASSMEQSVLVVEWAERMDYDWGDRVIEITLEHVSETSRRLLADCGENSSSTITSWMEQVARDESDCGIED
ncbi:MAG: tRNA (adenosine(37)-N6)-threonylcarbamoyltransferase complex ATPase subunit type 1 TsaE [Planctomycetota bacterium]|jgi:tRNA threonylcarbamoyladenosine biosynthesis protein TsaE